MSQQLAVVILAAGQGTRMKSDIPKVLHPLAGKPLVQHVIDVARELGSDAIHLVHGHGGGQVREALASQDLTWVEQAEQLGTGHAVDQVMPGIDDDRMVLVLYGDVPLITAATLNKLLESVSADTMALLTARLPDPTGYGRILRDDQGQVCGIVEQKDASPEQLAIDEVNTGIMAVPAVHLRKWLSALDNDNAQGEYYLTDIIAMAVADGVAIAAFAPASLAEIMGVNNKVQLAELERRYQFARAEALMLAGVTMADPTRFDLRGRLDTGRDVFLDINVIIEGDVTLGDGVSIGPNVVLKNVKIGAGCQILANSVLEDAEFGQGCRVGPFARVRPETRIADHCHIGNFVEIKKSVVSSGSKINHLTYVGDSEVGSGVNIGAGTITCNYDGANKHKTLIGNDVFIGSDVKLVAPVKVGDGATIGAGSVISRDAPAGELTLSRAPQRTIKGWQRPVKKKT